MRAGRAAVAGLLALLPAACLGIPSGGPVEEVVADEQDRTTAVYQPAPPAPDADPQQIVSGFLDAQLAFPPSTGVAEQFLTEEAADDWDATTGTVVYAEQGLGPTLSDDRAGLRVDLDLTPVVALDPAGHVIQDTGPGERSFRLARVDGQWRISSVPDGLLVTEKFYDDYYRAFDVFFFDAEAERLAPAVVHQPIGEQLPTSLVTSLARGPRDRADSSAATQLRTFLPDLAEIRASVPVSADGIAQVDLGEAAAELETVEQGKLAAQLVRTLQQVPDVTGVQISSDGSAITPDDRSVQPVRSWSQYVPRPGVEGPYALVDGAAVELVGSTARAVPEAWAVEPSSSELAVGSRALATVDESRTAVTVRSRSGGSTQQYAGVDVAALTWVTGDDLLVVDRPEESPRVRVLSDDGLRTVDASGLPAGVTSFSTSPDGTRYAVTVADELRIGPIVRDEGTIVSFGASREIPWDLSEPRSVTWRDGSTVAFLTRTDLGSQVAEGRIDGTGLAVAGTGGSPVLPDVDADELVVGEDQRWAVDARDRLWYLGSRALWTRPDVGSVRVLTPGP